MHTIALLVLLAVPRLDMHLGIEPSDADYTPRDAAYHAVLSPYAIATSLVTNAEFCEFLNANGNVTAFGTVPAIALGGYAPIRKDDGRYVPADGHAEEPVMRVSWKGARAYCKWLSRRTKEYYDLPTAAQWEAATGRGMKSGPSWEWTLDCYDPEFHRRAPLKDPVNFDQRCLAPEIRGGAARAARRSDYWWAPQVDGIGFRVVRMPAFATVPPPPPEGQSVLNGCNPGDDQYPVVIVQDFPPNAHYEWSVNNDADTITLVSNQDGHFRFVVWASPWTLLTAEANVRANTLASLKLHGQQDSNITLTVMKDNLAGVAGLELEFAPPNEVAQWVSPTMLDLNKNGQLGLRCVNRNPIDVYMKDGNHGCDGDLQLHDVSCVVFMPRIDSDDPNSPLQPCTCKQ